MLGTKYGSVEIVEYNPVWVECFEAERRSLWRALEPHAIAIEHVGSTAVPGLATKPTLDILAGLKELKGPEVYLAGLERIGYQFRPDHPVPGRLHFAKIVGGLRTHNLSLAEYGSEFWVEHLLFRDYLRSHADAARAYQELKRRLAEEYRDDTVGYTDGKSEFIRGVLVKARAWRALS